MSFFFFLTHKCSFFSGSKLNVIRLRYDIFLSLRFFILYCFFIVVQLLSRVWLFATPWTAAHQASLSFTISWSLPKIMPSNHFVLCCSLLLLPSIFPSTRVFSSELALCIRCSKYWSFSFSISPSNRYSELISLRVDWFDLFAVQGTLESLLQHQSSKALILWC